MVSVMYVLYLCVAFRVNAEMGAQVNEFSEAMKNPEQLAILCEKCANVEESAAELEAAQRAPFMTACEDLGRDNGCGSGGNTGGEVAVSAANYYSCAVNEDGNPCVRGRVAKVNGYCVCECPPEYSGPTCDVAECGEMKAGHNCGAQGFRYGERRLAANSVEECRRACSEQERQGCCEWQTDWNKCLFNYNYDTSTIGTMPARHGALCTKIPPTKWNGCGVMKVGNDCGPHPSRQNERVLAAKNAAECRSECKSVGPLQGLDGCCEWQTDWQKCVFNENYYLYTGADSNRISALCTKKGLGEGLDPCDGRRCGPSRHHCTCVDAANPYCNEENGYCGNTEAHKHAQVSTKYDWASDNKKRTDCEWYGTSPWCNTLWVDSKCPAGTSVDKLDIISRSRYLDIAYQGGTYEQQILLLAETGPKFWNSFGRSCWSGTKEWCCPDVIGDTSVHTQTLNTWYSRVMPEPYQWSEETNAMAEQTDTHLSLLTYALASVGILSVAHYTYSSVFGKKIGAGAVTYQATEGGDDL